MTDLQFLALAAIVVYLSYVMVSALLTGLTNQIQDAPDRSSSAADTCDVLDQLYAFGVMGRDEDRSWDGIDRLRTFDDGAL